MDHTLANILLLAHPLLNGHQVYLVEERQRAWLIVDETIISGHPDHDTVSPILLGGDVNVSETTGLRWLLIDEVLAFGPARGNSNEMTGERDEFMAGGRLLCVHTTGRLADA